METIQLDSKTSVSQKRLCNLSDIPSWYEYYEFVLTGYRIGYSWDELIWSAFECHNETANIWSELIPAIIYFLYFIYNLFFIPEFFINQTLITKLIIILFSPIPGIRMLISTFVHVTHCHNEHYSVKAWTCDYQGIILVCLGYNILYTYCTLYCEEPYIYQMYLAGSLPFYILSIVIVTNTYFHQKKLKELAMCSCVLVCNAALPFHIWLTYHKRNAFPRIFTIYWILELVIIVSAQLCRLSQWPEKKYMLAKVLHCLDLKNEKEYDEFCAKHIKHPEKRNSLLRKLCDEIGKECDTKWYFYYCPSHTIWHLVVNATHLLMIIVWCISFPVISEHNYCVF